MVINPVYIHQIFHDGFAFFLEDILTPDRQAQTVKKRMNKHILEEGFMNIIFNYSGFIFWLKYELENKKTFDIYNIFTMWSYRPCLAL